MTNNELNDKRSFIKNWLNEHNDNRSEFIELNYCSIDEIDELDLESINSLIFCELDIGDKYNNEFRR